MQRINNNFYIVMMFNSHLSICIRLEKGLSKTGANKLKHKYVYRYMHVYMYMYMHVHVYMYRYMYIYKWQEPDGIHHFNRQDSDRQQPCPFPIWLITSD